MNLFNKTQQTYEQGYVEAIIDILKLQGVSNNALSEQLGHYLTTAKGLNWYVKHLKTIQSVLDGYTLNTTRLYYPL